MSDSSKSEEEKHKKAEEERKRLAEKGQRLDIFVYAVDIFRNLFGF